jgi:hypothetical protein
MARTEALKEAQKRYMARVKGTPQGDRIYEKVKKANKEHFLKKYREDETFRKMKNESNKLRNYYLSYESGTFRAFRNLFGQYTFYGR